MMMFLRSVIPAVTTATTTTSSRKLVVVGSSTTAAALGLVYGYNGGYQHNGTIFTTSNDAMINTTSTNPASSSSSSSSSSSFQSRILGLQRELKFWSRVAPVVFDYWWHSSSRSPYVKFQEYTLGGDNIISNNTNETSSNGDDNDDRMNGERITDHGSDNDTANGNDGNTRRRNHKSSMYQALHDRNAPKIFDIMVSLGGLYVKLGQVLSVTALPVPSQYRELFKTLQSNVPGHEEFESVILPTIQNEFGNDRPLDEMFESIEEIPVGCASIGQAHRAKMWLKTKSTTKDENKEHQIDVNESENSNSNKSSWSSDQDETIDVIIKVQYPDARWQVPADIDCVGDFLKLCVYFGVIDESSASLSFEEFSRQFLSELEYTNEAKNLHETYESSTDPNSPYIRRGVVIPEPFRDYCTDRVIVMTYLPGPKFEESARKQLESLGIDTKRGMHAVFEESEAKEAAILTDENDDPVLSPSSSQPTPSPPSTKSASASSKSFKQSLLTSSWTLSLAESVGKLVGMDNIFFLVRLARYMYLRVTATTVRGIEAASNLSIVPTSWSDWAKQHENAAYQAAMLDWTQDAIDSLFDVHGYQIFDIGLFNADPHPGNILVLNPSNSDDEGRQPTISSRTMDGVQLGLIDWGQCKRLDTDERARVAKLIVSVADGAPDEVIASNFREMGIKTKNDSTKFLAEFAKLMFGSFRPEHMSHSWHRKLHEMDRVTYFPNELSMVYRTSLLLRGLAMSFQFNVSVGEKWYNHATRALKNNS
mmetsp:Transcript_54848/g.133197  ORF Transcript_54848/g.133197 Transcript_54848/m.133197 type:complete len:763 (-) Transcript_54848:185-2473(-)